MLIYLADLAHTYSTKNESLMVPLNIGYLKAYALEKHKDKIEIKLFKDPQKLLGSRLMLASASQTFCTDLQRLQVQTQVNLISKWWICQVQLSVHSQVVFSSHPTVLFLDLVVIKTALLFLQALDS